MKDILNDLGLRPENFGTYCGRWPASTLPEWFSSESPVHGEEIAKVAASRDEDYEETVKVAQDEFVRWRALPAPKRGEVVREIGNELRRRKSALGRLVSLETGKILAEGEGEVQEAIDIADFAVGLSRQLYGKTMHSERASHRMYEQWHPLGPVAVITAFNFPVAVWAWNAMIAAVCGDTVVWKPSELAPLSALATIKICEQVASRHGFPGVFTLVSGAGPALGKRMAEDARFPLVSATGSCAMGRSVGAAVSARLGRSLLELGGNNAVIVLDDANLDLAVRAIVFGAVGTAGQRCTSTRRVIVQSGIKAELQKRLVSAYRQVKIGNPLEQGVLMGPLINERAAAAYSSAVEQAKAGGATLLYGGERLKKMPSTLYVQPTIFDAPRTLALLQEETFAPILYLVEANDVDDAIALNNGVRQGLSSAVFTESLAAAERFLAHSGSDCGIANVNIGTSGAEIGGAFGGEKETGGGREAGSDSWKAYMRRQTNTINWGKDLPLAQGIQFL
ncbi:MAG: aldehyde dehydrogenase family protein [Bdellovibrionota bacterium]